MTTYVKGKCKEIKGSFGPFISLSIHIDEIQQHLNEKGYFNVTLSQRKEIGKYGDTHTIIKNDYTPKGAQATPPQETPDEFDRALELKKQAPQDIDFDSIPF